jgi:hypothetical protein
LTPSQAYWSLRLNYHALNIALTPPHNTVQLIATPLNANGVPLTNVGTIAFISGDSTVSIDSEGLVTAKYQTKNINSATTVIASLQYQNVTLADTAIVQVNATPPSTPLSTFALHSAAGSGTTCNVNLLGSPQYENCGPLIVSATTEAGDTLINASKKSILVAYTVSNPLVAQITSTGKITEIDTGHVTFSASTWAYGVAMQDSLPFVLSWPRYAPNEISKVTPVGSLTPVLVFKPSVAVSVGGTVVWHNKYAQPIDVVFDDSTAIETGCPLLLCAFFPYTGTGNIPPFHQDLTDTSAFAKGYVGRSFPVAGVYHYHSRLFPSSTGTVYVYEDLSQ